MMAVCCEDFFWLEIAAQSRYEFFLGPVVVIVTAHVCRVRTLEKAV